MPNSAEYKNFIMELMEPAGPVTWRNMFGGAGVFCDGLMFALSQVISFTSRQTLKAPRTLRRWSANRFDIKPKAAKRAECHTTKPRTGFSMIRMNFSAGCKRR